MAGRLPTALLSQRGFFRNRFLRRVVGILSPGAITWAARRHCGKSLGFNVTRKSAAPCSEHRQKGSSPGSGEMLVAGATWTNSASSPSKFMILPIVERRTLRRANTVLYSRIISRVTSQVNVSFSSQSRSKSALRLWGAGSPVLRPLIPATRTDVSTTPLGCFRLRAGNERDLRQFFACQILTGTESAFKSSLQR